MKSPSELFLRICQFFCMLLVSSVTLVQANNPYDESVLHPAIPLLDENGVHVLQSQQAYSPKKSCEGSGCHDYEKITHAYHFEFGRDEADDLYGLKRGIPQLVSPGYFGGYSCMGGSNPNVLAAKNNATTENFADYGSSGFIKDCYTCHAGGGLGEKDRNGIRYTDKPVETIIALDGDYYNRGTDENNQKASKETVALWDWKKSGVYEADCMICHTEFDVLTKFPASQFGPSEGEEAKTAMDEFKDGRKAMAKSGNFRYISNSIWELIPSADGKNFLTFERQPEAPAGDHGGNGKSTVAAKAGEAPPAPAMELAMDESGKPKIQWHAEAFDANGRISVKMLRFPDNENCMMCHRTSNSRRGFYGFGSDAVMELGEDGILETDLKDDVHKGKVYKAANGEERVIDNCNACHSSMYFKPSFSNVDLDAHHNFLKGDSDMDIRNDLDYSPGAMSCEYCHMTGPNLIIPSGQKTLLDAHREIWKSNGDMAGYDKDSLSKITKTHFDVVGCETCHITKLQDRKGKPLIPMYRYRNAENGKLKIMPSNPRLRYYWKDKASGRALVRFERDSAFKLVKPEDGSDMYGLIVDPDTGEELGRVSARKSHGNIRFGEPESYEAFAALKKVYDKVLKKKGIPYKF
ncbi:MAG: hypothetical protein V3U75_02810 [Methylococcaceae bacterium]